MAALRGPDALKVLLESDLPPTPLLATLGRAWTFYGIPGGRFEKPEGDSAEEALLETGR